MIKKPKKNETVTEWEPRPHLVTIATEGKASFDKASKVLADIQGGFQRFVVTKADGTFVPVVMLMPTEFTPDIVRHCERLGAHVMLGIADVHDRKRFP